MEAIQIRPATLDDAAAIADVHIKALDAWNDFYAAFYVLSPRESMPKATVLAMNNPSQNFVVAVDSSSGEVVGFVRYHVEDPDIKDKPSTSGLAALFTPKEHLKELKDRFDERDDEMDAVYLGASKEQRHYYIKHLMVHPDQQRKGIGKKLLSSVVAKSDAEGIPSFIVASAEAYGLYAKLGFEDLGTFPLDNGYWAKEITDLEKKLDIKGNEDFAQTWAGKKELERYMVRRPR
ncbi:acyl-CoA N-acyltransferase [Thozetella sp. PMI_491]|nr:acyl-CoA N-acyltransferase [Thozetella sp. PMI_491]